MLEVVSSTFNSVLGWIGNVLDALITTDGNLNALLPMFAIGIVVSGILVAVKVMRSLVWGA